MKPSIQIRNNKSILEVLFFLAILQYFIILMNPDISNSTTSWLSFGVLGVTLIFGVLAKGKLKLNRFIAWLFLFFIFSTLGLLYTSYPLQVFTMLKYLLVQFVMLSLFSMYISSDEYRLRQCISAYVWAAVLMCIYILINTDLSLLSKIALGAQLLGEGWNGNTIGLTAGSAALMILWLQKCKKTKWYYSIYLFLCTFVIFTASRKSIVLLLGGTLLYAYLVGNKSKRIRNVLFTGILVSLFIYLIITVPTLYDLVGLRFEGLLSAVLGQAGADSSALNRFGFIELAKMLFYEKPFLGYGLDTFRFYSGMYVGKETYSHNNYMELLVSVGMIGATIYYWMYVYILRRLFHKSKRMSHAIFSCLMIFIALLDYGVVSYTSFLIKMQILFCYSSINMRLIFVEVTDHKNHVLTRQSRVENE